MINEEDGRLTFIVSGSGPGRELHGVEPNIKHLYPNVAEMLRPILWPLVHKWNSVVCDANAMTEAANEWKRMAVSIAEISDDLEHSIDRVAQFWDGLAHRAFDQTTTPLVKQLKGMFPRADEASEIIIEAVEAILRAERRVGREFHELIDWASKKLGLLEDGTVVYLESEETWTAALPPLQARAGSAEQSIDKHLEVLADKLRPMRRRLDTLTKWLEKWESSMVFVGEVEHGGGFIEPVGPITGGPEPLPPVLPPRMPPTPPSPLPPRPIDPWPTPPPAGEPLPHAPG